MIAAAAAYYYMQYVKSEPTATTELVEAVEVETSAEQSSDSETDTLEVDTTTTEVCSNVEATE